VSRGFKFLKEQKENGWFVIPAKKHFEKIYCGNVIINLTEGFLTELYSIVKTVPKEGFKFLRMSKNQFFGINLPLSILVKLIVSMF
jgi:hypothetical protein